MTARTAAASSADNSNPRQPKHQQLRIPMMNSPTPTTGDNCRKLAVPIRFKGPIFPPVASSASPHKGRRTGVAETDPAWNALTEGRITSQEECTDLIRHGSRDRLLTPVP